jgi:hypothetical protein
MIPPNRSKAICRVKSQKNEIRREPHLMKLLSEFRPMPFVLALTVGLASLLIIGCASPEERAKKRPDIISKLNPDERQTVLAGKIKPGLSKDAVYIALGKPDRTSFNQEGKRTEERWIYDRVVTNEVPNWSYERIYDDRGRAHSVPRYDPIFNSYRIPDFEVKFVNGKVTGWSNL